MGSRSEMADWLQFELKGFFGRESVAKHSPPRQTNVSNKRYAPFLKKRPTLILFLLSAFSKTFGHFQVGGGFCFFELLEVSLSKMFIFKKVPDASGRSKMF